MNSQLTNGIKVTAIPKYLGIQEEEANNFHVFTYEIKIENTSPYQVRLTKRHWHIFDSLLPHQQVNGDGVIGKKPIINPGEDFIYESFCLIEGDYGSMEGYFTLINLELNEIFRVKIPQFKLISTSILN